MRAYLVVGAGAGDSIASTAAVTRGSRAGA
jgi:hypothetical protein